MGIHQIQNVSPLKKKKKKFSFLLLQQDFKSKSTLRRDMKHRFAYLCVNCRCPSTAPDPPDHYLGWRGAQRVYFSTVPGSDALPWSTEIMTCSSRQPERAVVLSLPRSLCRPGASANSRHGRPTARRSGGRCQRPWGQALLMLLPSYTINSSVRPRKKFCFF